MRLFATAIIVSWHVVIIVLVFVLVLFELHFAKPVAQDNAKRAEWYFTDVRLCKISAAGN